MTIATMSDKWQITLPAAARKKLGLRRKSKFDVEVKDNKIILSPVRSVREVRGIFREAAAQRPADPETVRNETERMVAEEVAHEGND